MYASSGIVPWKAVSNTATIGVFGINSSQALIPIMFAGLWSGANLKHSSIYDLTSASIITDLLYFSPPCTTLCPTAEISSIEEITPFFSSTKASKTNFIASLWSAIGCFTIYLSLPSTFWVKTEPSIPILSTNPCASDSSVVISINWYLSEELPQFITNTFIFEHLLNCLILLLCILCLCLHCS